MGTGLILTKHFSTLPESSKHLNTTCYIHPSTSFYGFKCLLTQGRQDSNPQPPITVWPALPPELLLHLAIRWVNMSLTVAMRTVLIWLHVPGFRFGVGGIFVWGCVSAVSFKEMLQHTKTSGTTSCFQLRGNSLGMASKTAHQCTKQLHKDMTELTGLHRVVTSTQDLIHLWDESEQRLRDTRVCCVWPHRFWKNTQKSHKHSKSFNIPRWDETVIAAKVGPPSYMKPYGLTMGCDSSSYACEGRWVNTCGKPVSACLKMALF